MRAKTLFSLALAGMFTMSSAGAAPSIAISNVGFDDDGANLAGTAGFPEADEESVVGLYAEQSKFDPAEVSDPAWDDAASAAGFGLEDALIAPIDGGLRFIWQLAELPPTFAPEVIRYNWAFAVGGNQYQLQAKQTNIANATTAEAPVEHVEHATEMRGFYQLRGRCTAQYMGTSVAGCYHLAFLDGGFDPANARVWIDLPYGQEYAEEIVQGVTLVESQSATMSITASAQAGVSNTLVSSYINSWTSYLTVPAVDVASSTVGTDPSLLLYTVAATLDEGGSWTATIPNGVPGRYYSARACLAATCSYAQIQA